MRENATTSISPRENLLKVFRNEQPEWIPLHIGYMGPGEQAPGFRTDMDPELDAALGTINWCDGSALIMDQYLGIDVLDMCQAPVQAERPNISVQSAEEDDGLTFVTTYKTPLGEMREVRRRAGPESLWYCVEHAVKTNDDLPALTAFFEDATPVPDPEAIKSLQERKAKVGDRGLVYCCFGGTPVGMMVRMFAGPETMAYLWADRDDRLYRLFAAMTDYNVREMSLCAELGADLIYNMDDTSTTCISPAMFEEFCMGYTDAVADAVHDKGAFYVHHSCGHVRDLLDLYRQTKMDAVDSLSFAPLGDVRDLPTALDSLGPNIVIMTGLGLKCKLTDENCAQESEQALRDIAPGKNLVLGVKAATMPETQFLAEECRKHQRMYAQSKGDKN